jgi:hypothetical protein
VNEVQTSVEECASDAERQFIVQALVGYNNAQTVPETHRDLTVLSRHDGEVVGGLLGHTAWNWLFVKRLLGSGRFSASRVSVADGSRRAGPR